MKIGGLLDQLLQSGQGALRSAGTAPGTGGSSGQGNALGGFLGGLGGGAAAAGAIGLLMGSKKARKIGGKVLTYGGLAALGVMAYKALSNRQQSAADVRTATAMPSAIQPRTVDRVPQAEAESHELAMLRAIIAAAKADGHIDDRERQMIDEGIAQMTSDREIQAWFDRELRKPLDPVEIARAASTPEMAAEMYLASLIVVDDQNFMERAYLDELARQMNIDPALQRELESQARQYGG